jgi:hypothetical protein
VSAERARLASVPPTITDHLILARTYFARAAALDPTDARVQGFHASFEMSTPRAARQRGLRAGLARGRAAIAAWPEFNWFTVGLHAQRPRPRVAALPRGAGHAVADVDACSRTPSTARPDGGRRPPARGQRAGPAAPARLLEQLDRAPQRRGLLPQHGRHAREERGLAHRGAGVRARPRDGSYPQWAFRDVLEARIAHAEENVAAFRRPEAAGADGPRMMLGSRFACVACHQQ